MRKIRAVLSVMFTLGFVDGAMADVYPVFDPATYFASTPGHQSADWEEAEHHSGGTFPWDSASFTAEGKTVSGTVEYQQMTTGYGPGTRLRFGHSSTYGGEGTAAMSWAFSGSLAKEVGGAVTMTYSVPVTGEWPGGIHLIEIQGSFGTGTDPQLISFDQQFGTDIAGYPLGVVENMHEVLGDYAEVDFAFTVTIHGTHQADWRKEVASFGIFAQPAETGSSPVPGPAALGALLGIVGFTPGRRRCGVHPPSRKGP